MMWFRHSAIVVLAAGFLLAPSTIGVRTVEKPGRHGPIPVARATSSHDSNSLTRSAIDLCVVILAVSKPPQVGARGDESSIRRGVGSGSGLDSHPFHPACVERTWRPRVGSPHSHSAVDLRTTFPSFSERYLASPLPHGASASAYSDLFLAHGLDFGQVGGCRMPCILLDLGIAPRGFLGNGQRL